jgi:hypothetical protein
MPFPQLTYICSDDEHIIQSRSFVLRHIKQTTPQHMYVRGYVHQLPVRYGVLSLIEYNEIVLYNVLVSHTITEMYLSTTIQYEHLIETLGT